MAKPLRSTQRRRSRPPPRGPAAAATAAANGADAPGRGTAGQPADEGNGTFLYQTVSDLLYSKIASRDLPPGALLKEGSIANQLGISRAPVRRALDMLRKAGLITSATGQGFTVGAAPPLPLSPRQLQEILADPAEIIDRSASWERIFAAVADTVVGAMPFGTYRIQETELGDHYRVSRTVAREVLWRLTDRRLIEKDRKSHWIVPQLTARDIRDTLEMRQVLEPQALAAVAPDLDRDWLEALAGRIDAAIRDFPAATAAEIDAIETAMFHDMYARLRNQRMLGSIRRNQVSLSIARLFRQHFPIRDDRRALMAYSQIVHHLLDRAPEVAQTLLGNHLRRSEPLTQARLRVLSVLPPPEGAPYLSAIHETAR